MSPVIVLFLVGLLVAEAPPPPSLPLPPHNSSSSRRYPVCPLPNSGGAFCPPFRQPPSSFPFAATPGCGHPSFQVRCSTPHSLFPINSSPFLLLSILPNNSLLLSLPDLPPSPIDFSGSPFRLSGDPCPFLSSLRPCRPPPDPSSSSFHLRLLSQPHLLFSSCSSSSSRKRQSCALNTTISLMEFLSAGIRVVWNPNDAYFSNCSSCSGSCGFDDSSPSKPFLCLPLPHRRRRRRHAAAAAAAAGLFSIVVVFVLILSLVFVALKRRRRRDRKQDPSAATEFLRRHHGGLSPPVFSYDQLRSSTNGFDPRCKIGDGGFGSVYLARLGDGRAAAVKRLHRRRRHSAAAAASFCNEVLILSSARHPNLVSLNGYCCDPRGLLLVYDYVPNGTLADHLHHRRSGGSAALSAAARLRIASQTAAALEYLHFSLKPPVVHRDITSSNIFLESDMGVKVGDFGLSRLLSPPTSSSEEEERQFTWPQGTPGYVDPDYHRSFRLTEKSDVYSFGVVMMELVTGRKALDLGDGATAVALSEAVVASIQVGKLRRVVDPAMVAEGEAATEAVEAVAELAFRCVAGDKDDRPDTRDVCRELRRIRNHYQLMVSTTNTTTTHTDTIEAAALEPRNAAVVAASGAQRVVRNAEDDDNNTC